MALKRGAEMKNTKIIIGSTLKDAGDAFIKAWKRAERGEKVNERIIAFENWEGLARIMTGERYRLLQHLHQHPEPSVSSLARSLRRQYRRVHEDVAVLEKAGLLDRSKGTVQTTSDSVTADIRF